MKKCIVNGMGDLAMDSEARKFIRKECVVIKTTKAGLIQVALVSDQRKIISLPKRNIDFIEADSNASIA